ncbi:fatty acid synthase-like [Ostrinia furnacalis]|uniref:fatty acid synthase-like n=1 Tax=Ostrinia furnacalis TaxID=93504 RepID=UPI001039DB22|nr:fatty acid synthase-like [Ostrinia furnacalis]
MAPTPQEVVIEESKPVHRPLSGDEVVISGMSGSFPKSDSVAKFMDNLYNGVDMVTENNPRWTFNHPEVSSTIGMVNGMTKFDAQFFRVHFRQACTMEPMSRKLLEHAYSAIFDSGINPLQLRGKKVGVFIGSTFSESEKIVIYENIQRNGFGITGCNKAMYANRISYWIDGKGPSYALDMACASSMACLEHAYRCISTGQCDAAIVGGSNLCMHPNVSLNMKRAGFLCLDGKSKCFDKNGDGYVRSDAISVLFLQKAKDAKRIYSEVYHAKSKYGLKEFRDTEFLSNRHPKTIEDFLNAFYSEIDVSPHDVEYIECHGSANAEADGNELRAIEKVFVKENPVKVGSVVSNMGHGEPASGACAVTKVCLAYHKGELPANLHYNEPQDDIPAVKDGMIQVVQKNVPFGRGFAALNAFSYSGTNVHVLLKGHYKKKDPERYKATIPHIVLASGRQEECVMKIFDGLKNHPVDPEQIGLLHSIHENEIPGHMCRGFLLLDTNEETKETVVVSEKVEHYPGSVRPLWFVYSGMGSQWATMGAGLMRIPIFAAAIEKCHRVLEPKGINIMHILTDPDKTIYDNILHSFVGIAAVQIGLTDILKSMGIVPDNIIGHSVGELGCAYADGCFTAEEMILSAYSRGLVSVQTPFIKGSMAAVGLGYKAILPMCPPEIEVACHNSGESSTISGPADVMKEFVADLTKKGIFAKEVPCSNIAYHSKYIAGAGPALLQYLSEVIKEPKERSAKWVSTSVPQEEWEEPKAKYSSAEYHTNNLLNSVLFEETSKLIPANAVVVEIAPHGLLQAILKRSLSDCTHIPLTRRGNTDPVKYLLEAIGKIYVAGYCPKVDVLYPTIEFPVSTETGLLSHFVGWEHSETWPEARYNVKDRMVATNRVFIMSIHDDDFKYYGGHIRDGTIIFPEAAYLTLVWETLAMYQGVEYKDMPVIFKDITFHAEANIDAEKPLHLNIQIYKGSNRFEVSCEETKFITGIMEPVNSSDIVFRDLEQTDEIKNDVHLSKEDIYKLLHLRGFGYKDKFQTLESSNVERNEAKIKWTGDWVTYIDALIQYNAFSKDSEGLSVPKFIKKLSIDPKRHEEITEKSGSVHTAQVFSFYGITRSGGVELDSIDFNDKPIKEEVADVLETQSFIPHFLTGAVNINAALQINLQVVGENTQNKEIKVTEMLSAPYTEVSNAINGMVSNITSYDVVINKVQGESVKLDALVSDKTYFAKSNLFVVDNLLVDEKKMQLMHGILPKDSFVMTLEHNTSKIHPEYKLFRVITAMNVQNHVLILLKKNYIGTEENVTYIPIVHDKKFSWVPRIRTELEKTRKIVLVSERQPYCGLFGLVKKLKKDYGNKIGLVVVDDYHAPSFHPENSVYKEQLQKNLIFNVFKKGQWGGYYNLPSERLVNIKNATLVSAIPGNLESLTWVEAPKPVVSNSLVQVHYAGVSMKDVVHAVGHEKGDGDHFGMDFSGLNQKGEKVMGLLPRGTLSSTVETDCNLTWPVPEHWTLEDAATVPLPYVHAYYCLAIKGRLMRNNTVFINGGAGALGQAVISICLSLGCTVFTAVCDMKKKRFLTKLFPELDESHIGNSRDGTVHEMVTLKTNGKCCDYVINTATGSLRESAMKCAGLSSKFMDLSDLDMKNNEHFCMFFLLKERNYVASNLSNIFKPENEMEKKRLQLLISEGIRKGIVRPLSRVVYSPNDVTRAFRLVSSFKQRGRVLIKLRDSDTAAQGISVIPRMEYSSNGTQVVVCDDQGLGIELIDHLVRRGARKFMVNVTANAIGGYFNTKLMSWKKLGVTLQILNDNISTEKSCMNLLTQGSNLGPVQGIFIVQNRNDDGNESFEPEDVARKFNETAMVVAHLDLMTRNLCPELKHFVVLTRSADKVTDEYANSVSEKICQNRNDVGLPGLVLRVGELDEFNKNSTYTEGKSQMISYSALFSALESSLKLNYKNVRAFNLGKRADSDFVKKIEKILGIQSLYNLSENLTLAKLSLNEMNKMEIIAAIKDTYKVSYSMDKVNNLTIGTLKNLSECLSTQHTDFDSGLGAFFTFIDDDECLATEPMVPMPTILNDSIEREEELDFQAAYLMLIPGFEGHYRVFNHVSERLKIQAMTFQLGPDLANETIAQMASHVLKSVRARFELKSKFYLLGYSFGVNVALEVAALMEKEGHVGKVFCLDSSPDALRVHLDSYIGNLSDNRLQNAIVEHLYRFMSGNDNEEFKKELEKLEDWTAKKEACVQKLKGLVKYSHQYQKLVLEAAYKRIKMAREYQPTMKLDSEIILIKGIPHPNAQQLPEDYNLSKYTNQPVIVYNIESDHALAPNDSRVSNIINRMLEPEVVEYFNKKNLCHVYFSDKFKML